MSLNFQVHARSFDGVINTKLFDNILGLTRRPVDVPTRLLAWEIYCTIIDVNRYSIRNLLHLSVVWGPIFSYQLELQYKIQEMTSST